MAKASGAGLLLRSGACAHGVEKTLEMMELQAGGEPGGS